MKNLKEVETQDDLEVLSIKAIKQRINTIQHILKDVMIEGVHYGKVPGCGDKPALLQPGAEIIMTTFRIAPDPEIIDLSTPTRVHYRIICRGRSVSGQLLGAGIGEGSSDEEKYAWRAALNDEEYNATPETEKRIKFKKFWNKDTRTYKFEQIKQIRTNPADVGNTVLKMTYKRSLVSMVRTITACSDVFAQDIDEGLEVIDDNREQPAEKPKPEPKPGDVKLGDITGGAHAGGANAELAQDACDEAARDGNLPNDLLPGGATLPPLVTEGDHKKAYMKILEFISGRALAGMLSSPERTKIVTAAQKNKTFTERFPAIIADLENKTGKSLAELLTLDPGFSWN
jgi:hypothetical protein